MACVAKKVPVEAVDRPRPVLYVNGRLVDADSLDDVDRVSVCAGFGFCSVEYVRFRHGHPLWLEEHGRRLVEAAEVLGFSGFSELPALLRRRVEGLACPDDRVVEVVLLPTAVPASAVAGDREADLVAQIRVAPPAGPLRLWLSTRWQRNQHSPVSTLHIVGDTELAMGRHEAMRQGYDEAVWTNLNGHVVQAGPGSVFVNAAGALQTPPVADGCLDTVCRERVLHALPVTERPLAVQDLGRADEIAVVMPWGSVHTVEVVSDTGIAGLGGGQLAARIRAVLGE